MNNIVLNGDDAYQMLDLFAMRHSIHSKRGKKNPTVAEFADHLGVDLMVAIDICRLASSVEGAKYEMTRNGEIKILRVA